MSKKKTGKKVVAKKENALINGIDFAADAGAGMEGTDKESFAIPFLRVLQQLSPQCDEGDAAFVEGAKAGMLYNTVSGKLYDGKEGMLIYPCAFQRRFLRWAQRGSNEGFKGEYLPEDVAQLQAEGQIKLTEDGLLWADDDGEVSAKRSDYLKDTRSHFCIAEDGSQVLLSLASSQIKRSKQLMSMMKSAQIELADGRRVTPPTWMNAIRIRTVKEQNDKGSWWGVSFEANGFLEDQGLYAAGKAFHDAIAEGGVRVNYAAAEETESTDSF